LENIDAIFQRIEEALEILLRSSCQPLNINTNNDAVLVDEDDPTVNDDEYNNTAVDLKR
jgi:hypothetical protein